MLGGEFIASVAIFAFTVLITPGPSNIIIATAGANFGFRNSIPTILGVSFGISVMILIVSFSIGGFLVDYPKAYTALRWFSMIFMCYLAWKIAVSDVNSTEKKCCPPGFWNMIFFQWINPKIWTMCSGAATAFISSGSAAAVQAIAIAAMFLIISLPCQTVWGVLGAAIGKLWRSNRLYLKMFNIAMSILMLAVFVPAILFMTE